MTAADTRNAKRIAEAKAAIQLALTQGWERVEGQSSTLRRSVEHTTPQIVRDCGWWPRETYTSLEFVALIVADGRTSGAVYGTARTFWTGRRDRSISVKRALEILRDPALSDVHLNHEGDRPGAPAPSEPAPVQAPTAPVAPVEEAPASAGNPAWASARAALAASGTRIGGFSLEPSLGECGAQRWAREVVLEFAARMGQLTSAVYTDQEVTPRREHQSPEFRNVLTLRCDAGAVVLFNDPYARGLEQWSVTASGTTRPLEFHWLPSTADLGYAMYRAVTEAS
jgi:hypothetical protein